MTFALSSDAIEIYHRRGFHFPVTAFSPEEIGRYVHRLESESDNRVSMPNPHLTVPWLREIVCNSNILDAVSSVIGPDVLCLGSRFFSKPANSPAYVSWHQDAEYLGLSKPEVITAWVAFTASTRASGCVRFIPGTHAQRAAHTRSSPSTNMLSLGQELAVRVDETEAVYVELEPGQMSLHHPLIFHGSEPNRSEGPRIGFGIQYIPTHVSSSSDTKQCLLLVRGEDRFNNFKHAAV